MDTNLELNKKVSPFNRKKQNSYLVMKHLKNSIQVTIRHLENITELKTYLLKLEE